MPDKGGKTLGPGPKRFAETTHAVLTLFTEILVSEAEKNSGQLSASDIRDIFESYRDEMSGLDAIYLKAWDQAIGLWMQSQWDRARTQLVERLLVHSFDRVLAPRGAEAPAVGKLSRRIVPAFIVALQTMMGDDALDEYQRRAQEMVTRLRQTARGEFDWEVVYDDEDASRLVDDILIGIARHFTDMDKRIDWFVSVANSNLGSPVPGGADFNWYFGEEEFHILFAAMYEDFRANLDTDFGQEWVENHFGRRAVKDLRDFLRRLDIARRELVA